MNARLESIEIRAGGVLIRGVCGGRGPEALLIHGAAGSWRNFRPWLQTLLPRCHLLIPDLPGCGESPEPSLRPSLTSWAHILHELTAVVTGPPRILVGLGLGASIALALLQTGPKPPSVDRLVLHTPAYYPGAVRPTVRRAVWVATNWPLSIPLRALVSSPRAVDWYLSRAFGGAGLSVEDRRLLRDDFLRASPRVLLGLAREATRAEFRPLLQSFPAPTLAMISARDPFVDSNQVERLRSLMPAASILVQHGNGHGWTADAIAEQNLALSMFLDGI